MDAFRFAPELLEIRNQVMETLGQAGFHWLSHYSAVDCLHDLYGIEVCGISDKHDARRNQNILRKIFPRWVYGSVTYKDYGRDVGWKVQRHRDPPGPDENWQTA